MLTGTTPVQEVTARLADLLASGEAADVQNVAITTSAGVQQMPSVAVDPHDADHVVIAYMDYSLLTTGYAGIGIALSTNGGASWQHSSIPLPPTFDGGASNPIAAFDDEGHVFVTFMAAKFLDQKPPILNPTGVSATVTDPVSGNPAQLRSFGFHANNGIFIARSDDAGLSWQPAVAVSSQSYDGANEVPFDINPDFVIDTISTLPSGQPNPRHGTFYVTFSRYYPRNKFPDVPNSDSGSHAELAVSSDGGQTWHLARSNGCPVLECGNLATGGEPGLGFYNYQHLAIGAEGDIAAAYFSASWIVVNHSHDGGAKFFVPNQNNQQGDVSLPFGPPALPPPFLENNRFRNVPMRSIAADPTRAGHLYVAEPLAAKDAKGNTVDAADIFFARSEDYGETWQQTILHGGKSSNDVVDDNGGQHPTGMIDDVIADQVMVKVRVNARGDIGLVWYDARRDPANHNLDVFGTVSTDGGKSFSPNFRVTDESFDANQGSFTDATGKTNYFIGDGLGLAMSNDAAYVAWTDTRAGNQDIVFQRVSLNPVPDPPNDRFEPNNSAVAATVFGSVLTRHLPKLALSAGDDDWFQVQSTATGNLTAKVRVSADSPDIQLEIYDATGQQLLADGNPVRDAGALTIWTAAAPAAAGESFLVRVSAASRANGYSLDLEGLTANLGPLVYAELPGALQSGDKDYYLLEAAAAGTVQARFAPTGDGHGTAVLEIIDRTDYTVLAEATGAAPELNYPASPGQSLLLRITSAADNGFEGSFSLRLTNLDQFASPDQDILHFPAGNVPWRAAVADFNRDGTPDVAVADVGSNVVSVSLGNGDGTFAAPRQFAVGAFHLPNSNGFGRDIAAADFDGDGVPDLAVTNYDSADVSILIGRGDGTFAKQQRYDAAKNPMRLAIGDVNGDGPLDLLVVDSPLSDPVNRLAILLGRGDGTFLPQKVQELPGTLAHASLALADFNHDAVLDLMIGGNVNGNAVQGIEVFRGLGDGSFALVGHWDGSRQSTDLAVADFDGDGNLDLVANAALQSDNGVALFYGDGNFGFMNEKGEPGTPQVFADVGALPTAVRVADWGSPIVDGEGNITGLGPPDGHADLILANSGLGAGLAAPVGPPNVVVLPALVDNQGAFTGFGEPQTLTLAGFPHDLEVLDLNGDGAIDIVVTDQNDFFVIFGKPPVIQPNLSPLTARKLGTVVHVVEPTLTITPQHSDAWYRLVVPAEVVPGAGDQILDVSGGFAHEGGSGLRMEVTDAAGNVLASGERLRVAAGQGETLYVHVLGIADGASDRGTGAYTLVIDTLPQVVAVEAQALLPGQGAGPGGPITNIVLVFQGDRLDAATAENPANYRITWLGKDGIRGTGDDRQIPVGSGLSADQQFAVYDASSNIDVASGIILPTAIRQTVTLLFGEPLPAGSYEIEVLPTVESDPFNIEELDLLSGRSGFTDHPVASLTAVGVAEGSLVRATKLVQRTTRLGDLRRFEVGTAFLTQFTGDLGALLDAQLTESGDDADITGQILNQIIAHIGPALGIIGQPIVTLAVFFLDPPSIYVVDPALRSFVHDRQSNTLANNLPSTYAGAAGNVTLLVIANPQGLYRLNVADVGPLVRGGMVYFGNTAPQITLLTQAMRGGQDSFPFQFGPPGRDPPIPNPAVIAPPGPSSQARFNTILLTPGLLTQKSAAPGASTAVSTAEIGGGGGENPGESRETEQRDAWEWLTGGLLKLWNEIRRRFRSSMAFRMFLLEGIIKSPVKTSRHSFDQVVPDRPHSNDVTEVRQATPPGKDVEPQPVQAECAEGQVPAANDDPPQAPAVDPSATPKSEDAEPLR